jgi:hypothetical protein
MARCGQLFCRRATRSDDALTLICQMGAAIGMAAFAADAVYRRRLKAALSPRYSFSGTSDGQEYSSDTS